MAEGALLSITSILESTLASTRVEMAYSKSVVDEVKKLATIFEGIQAVLLDAGKKQSSDEVKNWIRRIGDVLYDADDLFDEFVTENMLHLPVTENKLLKQVQIGLSKFSSFRRSSSLVKRVRAIRKRLDVLSSEAALFGFVESLYEEPIGGIRKGVGTGWWVDTGAVVGRNDELDAITQFLLDDYSSVSVTAIVGIMGSGKTTLAQLVYNSEKVQSHFENRWWIYVGIVDEKDFIRQIYLSITGQSFSGLSLNDLQLRIRDSIRTRGKFLLVLDDVWDENRERCLLLSFLLTSDAAKGSKIVVTSRSSSVAMAMNADFTCRLNALSSDASWELFTRIAFTWEQLNDPNWNNLGRKALKKCGNLPLAIKTLASLLYTKTTREEWKFIIEEKTGAWDGSIMSTLKLSYDHLPSNLKPCFAYCSLFPKDYVFMKEELIQLWMAQGFVRPRSYDSYEAAAEVGFMDLLRRFFFQEEKRDETGVIFSCKMHDLMHDLAIEVAGEASMILTETRDRTHSSIRHLSIGYKTDDSWSTPLSLPDASQLRSYLFINGGSLSPFAFDQLTRQKFLRAMDLRYLNIEAVPSSIGELIHLRYLNLSGNNFTYLPDSITKLLNLLTFNASSCVQLQALPTKFRKLINLRHLDIKSCVSLRYMPRGLEKLTCLQQLSYFKVGKVISGVSSSRLDALARLQLRGKLEIMFDDDIDNWDEDECWQIPRTVKVLEISKYPGVRIPSDWYQGRSVTPSLLPMLVRLKLHNSSAIKHLPPLRFLPYLKALHLSCLIQLECIEEEQDENESGRQSAQLVAGDAMLFFPCLEYLKLTELPKLKVWSRKVAAVGSSVGTTEEHASFPLLSTLKIQECPMLKSMPLSPCLQTVNLGSIREELIQQILSSCSHSLETMRISHCDSLSSFRGETLTSLQHLELTVCDKLTDLHLPLPQHNVLEELIIQDCPQLKLWGKKEGVDWDSLTNLCLLSLDEIPEDEMLPSWLQRRQSLGMLEIKGSL